MDDLQRRQQYEADELLNAVPEGFDPEKHKTIPVQKKKDGPITYVVEIHGATGPEVHPSWQPPQKLDDGQVQALGFVHAAAADRVKELNGLKKRINAAIEQNTNGNSIIEAYYGPQLLDRAHDLIPENTKPRQHLTEGGVTVSLRALPDVVDVDSIQDFRDWQRANEDKPVSRCKAWFDSLTVKQLDELRECVGGMPDELQELFHDSVEINKPAALKLLKEGAKIAGLFLADNRGDRITFGA